MPRHAHAREVEPARAVDLREEIASSIGLSGVGEGLFVLVASDRLAHRLVARMLQLSEEELAASDALDGFGELANMIAGTAKGLLTDTPFAFRIGLPTVVAGAQGTIRPGLSRVGPGSLVHASVEGAPLRFGVWLSE